MYDTVLLRTPLRQHGVGRKAGCAVVASSEMGRSAGSIQAPADRVESQLAPQGTGAVLI